MKRLLLFLILITWFVYAIGIPAFIQKNKINLTPEQEAAYQRKVQKRPDEYTFNPMHVGDKWWYHDSDGHLDCGKTVVADTIINNIQMFKHSSFGFTMKAIQSGHMTGFMTVMKILTLKPCCLMTSACLNLTRIFILIGSGIITRVWLIAV
jgi:hypothetical protein